MVHGDGEPPLLAPSGCLSAPIASLSSADRSAAAAPQLTRELGRARDRDHGRHADAKDHGPVLARGWSRGKRGSPRRLLLGEHRPVLKRPGCRCDTSRALLQRDDARSAAFAQRRRALPLNPTSGRPEFACRDKSSFYRCAARRRAATNLASPAWASR